VIYFLCIERGTGRGGGILHYKFNYFSINKKGEYGAKRCEKYEEIFEFRQVCANPACYDDDQPLYLMMSLTSVTAVLKSLVDLR